MPINLRCEKGAEEGGIVLNKIINYVILLINIDKLLIEYVKYS